MSKLFSVVLLCLIFISGCNGVQSAAVSVNPVTMTVDADMVFKNGRLQRIPRSVCGDTRAISPCGETRSIVAPTIRSMIDTGGGVRGLTSGAVSVRAIARAANKSAREIREEEKDAYETLKEIHKEEKARLTNIANATNPGIFGHVRRAFTCVPPITLPVTPVAPVAEVVTETPPIVVTTPLPDPNGEILGSGSIPPPSADKSIKTLESRVAKLEENQNIDHNRIGQMDTKLDAILAAVTKKN